MAGTRFEDDDLVLPRENFPLAVCTMCCLKLLKDIRMMLLIEKQSESETGPRTHIRREENQF
jgi:hypothetical protein